MKAWFFCMTVVSPRTGARLGKRVGIVFADNADHAQNVAWDRFGSDNTCQLWVEYVPETGLDFTVYKSSI